MTFAGLTLKKLFISEVKEEIKKFNTHSSGLFTEEDFMPLPLPVQKYFRNCGYIGKPKTINAQIFWKDVLFRRNEKENWLKLDCYQFNSVPEPCRIVYMKSRLFGFLPFEGRDKYQNGVGNMFIKIMKIFTVADAKSWEMNNSALVTTLTETLLLPLQALQPHIKWDAIDDYKAKATIKFGGNEVSGIFEFNDKFEMTRFVTNDRYQTQKDNSNKNVKWAGVAGNYVQKNGIKFPSSFSAVWYQDSGELEYFKGTIENITYGINDFVV